MKSTHIVKHRSDLTALFCVRRPDDCYAPAQKSALASVLHKITIDYAISPNFSVYIWGYVRKCFHI